MPNTALLFTDMHGKPHVVVTSTITAVEPDPGVPATPAHDATEEVPAHPGVPARWHGDPMFVPPTEAQPATEASPGDPGTPPTCKITHAGGSFTTQATAQDLVGLLNA